MTDMSRHLRLRGALTGQPVDRTPIWFMRQAGRYLPEYRAVRERVSFLDLCNSPELACEVTVQPIDRFDLDAAIIFSDILVIPQAMGMTVEFERGHGPSLPEPVRNRADLAALRPNPDAPSLQPARRAISMFREARPHVPILGFAGAPWTLLCYMTEGGGSQDWIHAKTLLAQDPEAAVALLNQLADLVGDHLQAQVEAGAAAVQLFDTWGGALSHDDYLRYALPAARRALARVSGVPRIYFTKDSGPFLHLLPESGADCIGLDWRVDLGRARRLFGRLPVQGNLDPIMLYAPPEVVAERTRAVLSAAGPVGHVFNLGHGITPRTPIAGVEAMVEAVKSYRHETVS
jgi:uroporphyrinogen decarboxylase